MLRDGYNVEFEGTATRSNEPTLLRENSIPRDQGWSWVVLLAAFLTLFVTNGVHTSFGILYAALLSHFKSGREETAWIGSISLGLLCFFSPIASLLIEHIGCRATSALGGFLCSLGFLLSSFATGIALLYFTHGLLFGLGTSLTYTAAMTVVTRSFERKRNIATGLCASGSQFGGIALAPLSQVLFDRLGYANTFRTFSGLLLVVTISSLAYKPELVENKMLDSSSKKSPKEMLYVWKNKAYVVWALATTMVTLGYNVPRFTLVKYAIDLNISKDASAWLLSYLCATSAIGRITFGHFCEWIPKLYLCQGCAIACAFTAFIFPFLKSYLGLVITCFIMGLPDGGFVASLPLLTMDIVGPERMSEGFGFMLFCQSYSNVIGPPLSGMLYDTYQSYKAAFCFAAVPEIIGVLMMFLIPYYTRNQVNYSHEIGFSSNSGILVEDGINIATSLSPVSENPILPAAHESMGNYNVIINVPVAAPPSDIRQVNVIINKTLAPETSCIDNANTSAEVSANNQIVNPTNETVEQTSEKLCHSGGYQQNTASNATIVASGCLSTKNSEYPQPSASVSQQVVIAPSFHCSPDDFGSLTQGGEVAENPNPENNSAHKIMAEAYPFVEPNIAVSENDSKMSDSVQNNVIPPTIPSHQLLAETILDVPIPSHSEPAERGNECLNSDIASLVPRIGVSDKSILLVNSSIKVEIPSNVAFVPGAQEQVETIIDLVEEQVLPQLTPPPQHKGHTMRMIGDVRNIELAEQTITNEQYHDSSIAPLVTSPATTGFPASLEAFVQENIACSQDLAFTSEVATPSVSIAFAPEGTVNQNESSLMTSAGITDTFPLVQDQLPEPLKPTSVCSVMANVQTSTTNSAEVTLCHTSEKAADSSPLSSELSTVIADVIQSLASQHTATQKPKESTTSNIGHPPANSQSREHAHKIQTSQTGKHDTNPEQQNLRPRKESCDSRQVSDVSPRSKMQTSVLDTMQSIVAEGCPEDLTLLEDISIDLSLDKDPSVASIVILDDRDIASQHSRDSNSVEVSPGGLSYEIMVAQISGLSAPGHVEQPIYPTATAAQATFLQDSPILNVFSETLAAQQNFDPLPVPAELINPIESTNPFYNNNNTSQV